MRREKRHAGSTSCAVSSPNPHSTKACESRTGCRSDVGVGRVWNGDGYSGELLRAADFLGLAATEIRLGIVPFRARVLDICFKLAARSIQKKFPIDAT